MIDRVRQPYHHPASRYQDKENWRVFPRQQSLQMQQCKWEGRLNPLRPWLNDIATLALGLILLGMALGFLPFIRDLLK